MCDWARTGGTKWPESTNQAECAAFSAMAFQLLPFTDECLSTIEVAERTKSGETMCNALMLFSFTLVAVCLLSAGLLSAGFTARGIAQEQDEPSVGERGRLLWAPGSHARSQGKRAQSAARPSLCTEKSSVGDRGR